MGKTNKSNEPYKVKVNILFLGTYLKVPLEKKQTISDMIQTMIQKNKKKIEKQLFNNETMEQQEKQPEFGLFDEKENFQYNPEYLCKDLLVKDQYYVLKHIDQDLFKKQIESFKPRNRRQKKQSEAFILTEEPQNQLVKRLSQQSLPEIQENQSNQTNENQQKNDIIKQNSQEKAIDNGNQIFQKLNSQKSLNDTLNTTFEQLIIKEEEGEISDGNSSPKSQNKSQKYDNLKYDKDLNIQQKNNENNSQNNENTENKENIEKTSSQESKNTTFSQQSHAKSTKDNSQIDPKSHKKSEKMQKISSDSSATEIIENDDDQQNINNICSNNNNQNCKQNNNNQIQQIKQNFTNTNNKLTDFIQQQKQNIEIFIDQQQQLKQQQQIQPILSKQSHNTPKKSSINFSETNSSFDKISNSDHSYPKSTGKKSADLTVNNMYNQNNKYFTENNTSQKKSNFCLSSNLEPEIIDDWFEEAQKL